MAGTYSYMKVAKMVMDASSVMFIDSSNAVLKSTSLTATNLVTKKNKYFVKRKWNGWNMVCT